MGMFDNYDNLSPDYIPDNSSYKVTATVKTYDNGNPKSAYNIKGEFVGFSVNEGDTYKLDLGIKYEIMVEADAIHFIRTGECPSSDTKGYVGRKAYNTIDIESYTCNEVIHNIDGTVEYVWSKDNKFTYPSIGELPLCFYPYSRYDELEVSILNFRNETIKTILLNSTQEELIVDKEISDLLSQGIYKIKVVAQDEENKRLATMFNLIVGSGSVNDLTNSGMSDVIYSTTTNNFVNDKLNTIMLAVKEQSEKLDRALIEVTNTISELI